jgi:chemotaxis protein histidine kinase CheA
MQQQQQQQEQQEEQEQEEQEEQQEQQQEQQEEQQEQHEQEEQQEQQEEQQEQQEQQKAGQHHQPRQQSPPPLTSPGAPPQGISVEALKEMTRLRLSKSQAVGGAQQSPSTPSAAAASASEKSPQLVVQDLPRMRTSSPTQQAQAQVPPTAVPAHGFPAGYGSSAQQPQTAENMSTAEREAFLNGFQAALGGGVMGGGGGIGETKSALSAADLSGLEASFANYLSGLGGDASAQAVDSLFGSMKEYGREREGKGFALGMGLDALGGLGGASKMNGLSAGLNGAAGQRTRSTSGVQQDFLAMSMVDSILDFESSPSPSSSPSTSGGAAAKSVFNRTRTNSMGESEGVGSTESGSIREARN